MSMDELRLAAESLRTRLTTDPAFKAKVWQDPQGTLSAAGYADAIVSDMTREIALERGDDVSGFCAATSIQLVRLTRRD